MTEDIDCDVLIVGAGITGAICAYYFAKAGINVVVVDKSLVAYGSTSASTSLLQYEIDNNLTGLSSMIGLDKAVTAFKLCRQAVYDISDIVSEFKDNCEFKEVDCLLYSNEQNEIATMDAEYNLRKKYGFDVSYLNGESAKSDFSFPITCGIYSRNASAQINPYKFSHQLLNDAVINGSRIFENTEVVAIESDEQGITAKTSTYKTIKAKKAIITMGYESIKYILEEIVTITRTYTIVTEPISEIKNWKNQCLIRDSQEAYYYLRTTQDNRIIIGGEDNSLTGLPDIGWVLENKANALRNKLITMFPYLEGVKITHKFSGLFGNTNDGLPYIGEYKPMPNCYFNLGYGANGILYAIFGAQMLLELYLGTKNPSLELFKFGRKSCQ